MIDKDGRFTYSPVIKINIVFTIAKITVFPNPVVEILTMDIQATKNETVVFTLFNEEGKLIASKSFTVIKGNNRLSWDLQKIAKGNYFIAAGSNQFETIKVIKD